jgi:hypothetical protein
MSRYVLTATKPTQNDVTIDYTDRSSAIRGAKRYLARNPDSSATLVDTATGRTIWEQQREAQAPTVVELTTELGDVNTTSTERRPVDELPSEPGPRRREPRTSVRPFSIKLFERGDEIYDIEAQATEHPMRLRVVIVGGSDPGAEGEVLGLLEWRNGVNRWVPALPAWVGAELTNCPRPDWTGKPVSGKTNAVGALFDLLRETGPA